MTDTHTMEEKRFHFTFWFITGFGIATLLIICGIVFGRIPHENQQSANMALAFCMSAFTGLTGYLIGASPEKKRQEAPAATPTSNTTVLTLRWLGAFDDAPQNPAVNDAYSNNTDKKNYYWNGSVWVETTQNPA